MTSSPGRITPWISVPASLLVWILLLALDLKVMLGAGLSGGWLLAGVMFTFSAIFIIWMVSEIVSAVHTQIVARESLRGVSHHPRQPRLSPQDAAAVLSGRDRFDMVSLDRQRHALGLANCQSGSNRQRRGK